ncbi:MAG TPA: hypothetical protein VE713_06070 [Pyrinomonadaceae bacterium]|jgi:hypothetical protein|nr:hypothetical protein [Pyrinomonadaceae bacterium]
MRKRTLAAVAIIIVIVSSLIVLAARGNKPGKPQPANRAGIAQASPSATPQLISKTRDAGVYIESAAADETNQVLSVFVRNDTDKDVESFIVQGGDELQGAHGGTLPGQPPAIAPHSVARLTFSMRGEAILRRPIILKAMIFADGTGVGEKKDLDATKAERQKVFDVHARDGVTGAKKGGEWQP